MPKKEDRKPEHEYMSKGFVKLATRGKKNHRYKRTYRRTHISYFGERLPIPKEWGRPSKYPFKEMAVGSAFIVKDGYYRNVQQATNDANKRWPDKLFKYKKTANDTVTVWRIV